MLFVGLACFDVVSVCDRWPEEDTDNQVLQQAIRRGGNASNSCTCFASLIRWHQTQQQQQKKQERACDYQVEFFGTLGGDIGSE